MATHSCSRRVLVGVCVAFAIATFTLPALAAATGAVVQSPDIENPVTRDRLATCIHETARALGLTEQPMPHIIVLHVSKEIGEQLGFDGNHVFRNAGPSGPNLYYELWMVGAADDRDLALGVESVFETHFGLEMSDPQRISVLQKVLRYLSTTVDAKSFGKVAKTANRLR